MQELCECFRDEEEDESNSFVRPSRSIPNEELHFSEKWFHGKLARGREEAEDLLKMYSHLGKFIRSNGNGESQLFGVIRSTQMLFDNFS